MDPLLTPEVATTVALSLAGITFAVFMAHLAVKRFWFKKEISLATFGVSRRANLDYKPYVDIT